MKQEDATCLEDLNINPNSYYLYRDEFSSYVVFKNLKVCTSKVSYNAALNKVLNTPVHLHKGFVKLLLKAREEGTLIEITPETNPEYFI